MDSGESGGEKGFWVQIMPSMDPHWSLQLSALSGIVTAGCSWSHLQCVSSHRWTICLCLTPRSCQSTGPSWIFAFPTKHTGTSRSLAYYTKAKRARRPGSLVWTISLLSAIAGHSPTSPPRVPQKEKSKSPSISVFSNILKEPLLLSVLLPAKGWYRQGPTSYLCLSFLCCKSPLGQKR